MKVLMMADVPEDANSGAAGTEFQTVQALRRLGHEVDALWSDSLPRKIKHGNLHYLFELPRAYRSAMQKALEREPYDVIHVNQPHGYLAARALGESNSRTVFIHRSHGFESRVNSDLKPWRKEYDRDNRPLLRKLMSETVARALSYHCRSIARYADGHIVSAEQCRDFLHARMRVPVERIAVIPQAAAPSFLERSAPAMTPARLKRVLYVGQFAFVKAPMIVAAVINRIANADKQVEFTWVCSSEHHNEVRRMLGPAAQERVRLMGWMPQEDLLRVCDSHGIFLFPSFFEGFGKAFLEAMSRGLCVIAADNGGARDVITHEVDGLLAPTGSVEIMAESCLRLIGNQDEAMTISLRASKTAQCYTWDRVARETAAFYQHRIEAKARQLESYDEPAKNQVRSTAFRRKFVLK